MTLRETALVAGVSHEAVRLIESRALERLRSILSGHEKTRPNGRVFRCALRRIVRLLRSVGF